MAPRPKPTRLKILAGNPGKRRLNEREPQLPIPTELPQPPMPLSRVARKEWVRTGGLLLRSRVLTEADLTAFAAYCVVYGRWVEAEGNVRRRGLMVPAKPRSRNLVQNPFLSIANKSLQQMLRLWAEFGLTPSSRTRIISSPASEDYEEKRKAEKHLGPQIIRPTPPR